MSYTTVHVDEVIRESQSGAALLLRIGDDKVWIPRSQIREPEDADVGRCEFDIEVSEWIAKEKGLI